MIVHVAASRAAGVGEPKQEATSKHSPPLAPPSGAVEASGLPPSGAPTVGTAEEDTALDEQLPRTQVCPPGHVESIPPSASACAEPSQRYSSGIRSSPVRPLGIGVTASRSIRGAPDLNATARTVTGVIAPVACTSNRAGSKRAPLPISLST